MRVVRRDGRLSGMVKRSDGEGGVDGCGWGTSVVGDGKRSICLEEAVTLG